MRPAQRHTEMKCRRGALPEKTTKKPVNSRPRLRIATNTAFTLALQGPLYIEAAPETRARSLLLPCRRERHGLRPPFWLGGRYNEPSRPPHRRAESGILFA